MGAWRSVNDIQAQLGKEKFSEFLSDVEAIIDKRSIASALFNSSVDSSQMRL